MKPDWDKLMNEYKDSTSVLVADIDCTTAAGKAKCQEVGIRGYPSLKYGDPDDLQDYKGSRSYNELKKFAEGLSPVCSPLNVELCDEEKKKLISELSALSPAERDALINKKEAEIEKLEAEFKATSDALNKEYQEVTEQKEKAVEAARKKGLALLKSVHLLEEKKAKKEL
mmetsp:Transcript_12830/g.25992  ORF Transcript_12830/g.25992 Transcript_12830/m.25992 type:complete len:170 (-) Transcript_12830:130-639(-)|eukprot:CAMPEP_0113824942 /NCGR_PEP_ID=MMETSP0328-20130328/3498_1 /TAXON_ID=39455 /ORGANISM="Alexandrium minutum" /LENGTH=169 /DNA_ID=CAMNT_0000792889 /DNA_START=69 /DNA_END=578 /DNA_ORIENTATION=+ /assembly_acc=CAM_ASM_000350